VTDLEVDALSGRFGRYEDLDGPFTELLLGKQAGPGLVSGPGLHAAVDEAHPEPPAAQLLDQVVKRVLELGEDEETLLGAVKEPLAVEQVAQLGEFRLSPGFLHRASPTDEGLQFRDLLPHLLGVLRQGDRGHDFLQMLALGILHLFELLGLGDLRRSQSGQFLGALQPVGQPAGAVLQRPAQGVGAGGQPALEQRHEEAHSPGPRVAFSGCGCSAVALDKPRHLAVEVEFRAVDPKVDGVRNPFGEDFLSNPRAVGLLLGEVDHRLLGAAQVKGRPLALHRLANGLHVCKRVLVQELQEVRKSSPGPLCEAWR
jgi:hypothetical protein